MSFGNFLLVPAPQESSWTGQPSGQLNLRGYAEQLSRLAILSGVTKEDILLIELLLTHLKKFK
jgi:hypothetical protein